MAKEKKLYWLGKGLVKVDGKLYGKGSDHGRAFPTAKVDAKRLAQWVKDGRASNKPFEDDAGGSTAFEQLQSKVRDLSAKLVAINGEKEADIKPYTDKIAELEAELAEVTIGAKKTIKDLEKDLKKAGSGECENCKEKVLRIVELGSEVERLTAELEEATKPADDTTSETGS